MSVKQIILWYRTTHPMECFYCGAKLIQPSAVKKYPHLEMRTVDHVVPKVHGGLNSKRNTVPSCGTCNTEKDSRDLEDYRDFVFAGKFVSRVFYGEKLWHDKEALKKARMRDRK